MAETSLAAKMIEEMERNVELRRRFLKMILAEIALEPDIRIALANAIIREAATKSDLLELSRRIEGAVEERAARIESSMTTKGEFKTLNNKVETLEASIAGLSNTIKGLNELGAKISSLESSMGEIKASIRTLEELAKENSKRVGEAIAGIEGKITAAAEGFEIKLASLKRPVNIAVILSLASLATITVLALLLLNYLGMI